MGRGDGSRPAYSFDAIIFEPSIRHLIAAARPHIADSVLDLACGSGIATCKAGMLAGERGRVCGVDIGPNILKKAASLYTGQAPAGWVRADMMQSALRHGLVQPGAVPPGPAVRRRPGGRGGRDAARDGARPAGRRSCAGPTSPTVPSTCPCATCWAATWVAPPPTSSAAPFSLPEEEDLRALLAGSFAKVSVTRISVRTAHPSAGAFAAAFLRYLPPDCATPETVAEHADAIVAEMDRRLGPWQADGPLIAPIVAHLALCR